MPTYAQVVEWGKCQLIGCFVGGLSGDELCAQSACLVCGRASLFALNSTFEFTGMLTNADVCNDLCAQSACLVCCRASLFALNSTFEFTGASTGAAVSTYDVCSRILTYAHVCSRMLRCLWRCWCVDLSPRGSGARELDAPRYAVYLLYWYKSTNSDAAASSQRLRGANATRLERNSQALRAVP